MIAITRPEILVVGNVHLPIPVYFPSISTVKTALTPEQYLAVLHSLRDINRQFLVSAFDLGQATNGDELRQLLTAAQAAGVIVLMDSGNYESYWKDKQATWQQADFHDVVQRFPCSFVFGFDEQDPPMDLDAHVDLIVKRWHQDQEIAGDRLIVPIVHGRAGDLPILCKRIVQETRVPMIAVAERQLGDGIFERTLSVMALRQALNDTGQYVGLHLLGTGNPISIAIYVWAGADSFDGLEWCQTVVDHDSALLFHLSQSDFFRWQTAWGEEDISFHARTLAHNLTFYTDWMQRLGKATQNGDVLDFCRFNFPLHVFRCCAEAFGWE